jgi:hypothetical protein
LRSVTFEDPHGKDVLLTKILAEGIERSDGSGLQPIENGGDGLRVDDVDLSQHEFDSIREAEEFAQAQHNPDRIPVETEILEFSNRKWKVVRD